MKAERFAPMKRARDREFEGRGTAGKDVKNILMKAGCRRCAARFSPFKNADFPITRVFPLFFSLFCYFFFLPPPPRRFSSAPSLYLYFVFPQRNKLNITHILRARFLITSCFSRLRSPSASFYRFYFRL